MVRTPIVILFLIPALFFSPSFIFATEKTKVSAQLSAVLSETGDTIFGTVTYTFQNNTNLALEKIPLWLYPNRFNKPNPGLDEGMLRWVYPHGLHSAGGMTITGARWNGRIISAAHIHRLPLAVPDSQPLKDVIAEAVLPEALLPKETGRLTLSFKVTIPKRRGRFGRDGGVISLGGGWFPVPMTDLTGKDPRLPPDAMTITARVGLPANLGAVLHDAVFPVDKAQRQIEVKNVVTESLVLVVMDRMEISERVFDWGTAVHVHQSLCRKDPSWKNAGRDQHGVPEALPAPGRFDYSSRLLDVVEHTADIIKEVAPTARLAKRVVLVDIPAWDRMVQPGFGPVLVSDRLWRMLPIKDGLFFHDLALVRALAPTLVFESSLRNQSPLHRFIAADVLGVFFADYYSKTIHKRLRSVEDIIGFARFIPTIDNLLYAPQIPFREVYFRFFEEPEPLRDEPWMFMNQLPRGKRILAKLEDRADRTKIFEAVRNMLEGGEFFEHAVRDVLGEDPVEFFSTWYGPYPVLNYRLGKIKDVPLPEHRFRHEVEVIRDGAVVREKVAVRILDKEGLFVDRIWDKAERRTVLSWTSGAPLDEVEIDPNGRLVESAELTTDHPLGDNSRPLSWRPPMFTRLVVWGDLTAGEPYVELGFWLRRKYDTTNVFGLDLEYTPYTVGGVFSYYRFFGKKRTLNSRTWFLSPMASAIRYGEVDTPALHLSDDIRRAAIMGSVGLMFGRDTRVYGWDPMKGSSVSMAANYAAGAADNGSFRQMGHLALRMGKLFSPGIHHTFALYGGAAFVLGNPVAANLTSLSDRAMLRGFDSDETFGRIGFYAAAEYRHTLLDAVNLTAPLYSWFDRFQGALFLAGGTISKPSGPVDGLFTEERFFTEIGYGLRLHLLLFGMHQYLLCFDLAVPLTPASRVMEVTRSDGVVEQIPRSPYKIIFGIIQTF